MKPFCEGPGIALVLPSEKSLQAAAARIIAGGIPEKFAIFCKIHSRPYRKSPAKNL